MKTSNVLNIFFIVIIIILASLYVREKSKLQKLYSEESLQESDKQKIKESEQFFESLKSEPVDSAKAKKRIKLFREKFADFPTYIYIDTVFINHLRNNPRYDGMKIYFMQYDSTGQTARGSTYKKNEVNVVLAPTTGKEVASKYLYNYGDPCRPICRDKFLSN